MPAAGADSFTAARPSDLLDLYGRMLLIRRFEERIVQMYRDGQIPGFVHVSIGQEASAVGTGWPLRPDDGIVSTHRGHGHCLAKGASPEGMVAELMGRWSGTCHGLGGSMHIAEVSTGIFGANGIVAAGLPIACGIATARRLQRRDAVTVAYFGDGAVNQGAFHEAMNLASIWSLPVIFVCENNGYAEFSPAERQSRVPVVERAASYGMPASRVDGNDVEAVASAMSAIVEDMRVDGTGPFLLETTTFRHHGHYEGDPQRYRSAKELEALVETDPLARTRRRLCDELDVDPGALEAMDQEVKRRLEKAVASATEERETTYAEARTFLFAPSVPHTPTSSTEDQGATTFRVMDAVTQAIGDAMEEDPSVWMAGIDVESGNIFALTRGLAERFPGRVRDTPISETAILGCGVGAALAGTRPIVELEYLDFLGVCLDQLLNQAAKARFMTGGELSVPLVVRSQYGAGRSSGAQHSQSLEAILAHIPGLIVAMPSTPEDTYGILRAAIDEPNPVVVIDHRLLYGLKGQRPVPGHRTPLGKGIVRRPGTTLTLVSWSRMVHEALAAAEVLAAEKIEVEVIDMRTVAPLDIDLVAESVKRTGRLLIAHEAVVTGGVGAEIAARLGAECFWSLDAPVVRVAPDAMPAPYAAAAEAEWLTGAKEIEVAAREMARA